MGEAGCIATGALFAQAVEDALGGAVEIREIPLSPNRLFALIQAGGTNAVKPAPFRYHRPETVEEALDLLAEYGGEAKPLAGGQSLVPAMNFRLAQPAVLVDLNRIPTLAGLDPVAGGLRLGGMTRQRVLERQPGRGARWPRSWPRRCRWWRTLRSARAARSAAAWRMPIPPPNCRR